MRSTLGVLAGRALASPLLAPVSVAAFLLILIAAAFLIFKSSLSLRAEVTEQFNLHQLALVREAAARIEMTLDDLDHELNALLALLENSLSEDTRTQILRTMFNRYRQKGMVSVGMVDGEGNVRESYHQPEASPGMGIGYALISPPEESTGVYAAPLIVTRDTLGSGTINGLIRVTVTSPAGAKETLFLHLDLTALFEEVLATIATERSFALCIDSLGRFIYHPNRKMVGWKVKEANSLTLSKSEPTANIDFKSLFSSSSEGTTIIEASEGEYPADRIEMSLAYSVVRYLGPFSRQRWTIGLAVRKSDIADAVYTAYLKNFGAAGLLLIGMFLFGLLAALYQRRLARELTARVRWTEADLHKKEQFYRRIVERATDLIFIVDRQGRVLMMNQPATHAFSELASAAQSNRSVAQNQVFTGQKLSDFLSESDWAYLEAKLNKTSQARAPITFDHTVHLSGRNTRFSTTLVPVSDETGATGSFIGITRDITERTALDHRLYQTEKLASIGTLAAGVAHEINNPLAVILGFTELLLEKYPEGSTEFEDLKIIEQNCITAKRIVDDLLGFARSSEAGRESVDIGDAVHRVTGSLKQLISKNRIQLDVEMEENLPRIAFDAREFQQVLVNLVTNAVAAVKGIKGRISISCRKAAQGVEVSVADNGCGIPDRVKQLVFDPFWTTKPEGDGTGLGLSVTYGIITKWGGRISFTSTSREDNPKSESGTTFTLLLPVGTKRETV